MLFDMLTADAASKHGHEFSDPQPARWLVPRRSPFRVFPYAAARNKLASRSRTSRGTMGDLKEEPEELDDADTKLRPQISIDQLRIPGSFHYHPPSPPLLPPTEEIPSIPLPDPPSPIQLSPVVETPQSAPEKRYHRSKIRYAFAHPPPTGAQLRRKGIIIRPRTLFQLHTQTSSGFHRPAYEVLPLNLLENNNTLMQGLKRVAKSKLSLMAKDLVIIKSDHYKTEDNIKDLASRDVLGILSASQAAGDESRPSAQLVFDGSAWTISQTRKDTYDLVNTADASQCARWYVPKAQKRNSINSQTLTTDPKFYFAVILPNTKKHPTVASMNKSFLDIYDSFTSQVPHGISDDYNSDKSHPVPDSSSSNSSQIPAQTSETPVVTETDELLRRIIVVSAVWIAFCEGWSPHMNADVEPKPVTPQAPATLKKAQPIPVAQDVAIPSTPASTNVRSKNLLINLRRSKPVETPASTKIIPEVSNAVAESQSKTPIQQEKSPAQDSQQITIIEPPTVVSSSKPPVISIATPVTAQKDADVLPYQDPTAQFRHIMAMDLPTSTSPVSRLESLVRRRSTHGSPSISRESSRNRSVSWTRHLSIHPNSRIRDLKASSQSPSRASSDHDAQSIETPHDQRSDTYAASCSTRSMTPPVSPSPQNWHSAPIPHSPLAQSDTQVNSADQSFVDQQPEPVPATAVTHLEPVKSTPVHLQQAVETSQMVPVTEAISSRPSTSDESDDSLYGGIGDPYWKDFDRIQSRAFVQRSEQVQREVLQQEKHVQIIDPPLAQNERDVGTVENETVNGRAGWFSGIRRSVRRRRRSMVN